MNILIQLDVLYLKIMVIDLICTNMEFCVNTMETFSCCILDVDTLYIVTFQGEDGEKGDGGARGFPGATVGSSKY